MSDAATSIEVAAPKSGPAGPALCRRQRLKAPWQVWRDAAGRLSALRIVALLFLIVPVVIAVYDFNTEGYGARPLNNVIHRTGYWALIFLMVSLAITPLRRIGRFGALLDVRRMIGVGAFVYAAAHILLYVADQMFDLRKVASEIVLRLYLTIGFVALLGLDGAGRDLDRRHGAAARRQELAAPAQRDLCDRPAGADPFLPADQGRCGAADLRRRRCSDG